MAYYGVPVTLLAGDGTAISTRAFVRPVTAKSTQNLRRAVDELGELPAGTYLYLGPPEHDLPAAARVACGGVRYIPRRSELLMCGTQAVCRWGLLEREGEADDEGTD